MNGRRAGTGFASRASGYALLLAAFGALSGCSTQLPPPGTPPEERFQWALDKYNEGKYGDAAKGFVDFVQRAPTSPRVDSALYLVGESYLRGGDQLRAATEFNRFASTRPNSPLADDAQLGACRAYWELSPSLARDQEYTRQAIEECTRMLQFFPASPRRAEADSLLREARDKIAAKQYRVGKYYFDQRFYESANIYFEVVVEEHPDAPVMPDVLATLYESYRKLGFDAEAEHAKQRLLTEHPDSEAARKLAPADGS